jgi:SAM-dependent methyltransferase
MTRTSFLRRDVCPACDGADAETLARLPYDSAPLLAFLKAYYAEATDLERWLAGATYEVVRCRACTLVFQRNVGGAGLLTALYDVWLNSSYRPEADAEYLSQVAAPARTRDGHELFAVARTLGGSCDSLRVLDYGMGWGLWARIAHGLGAMTYGFDLSASRCEYARAHGIEVVELDDLRGLGVDFVNADQVFEHLTSPVEVATLLASALRPGGILKIAVPRADDIASRLRSPDFDAPRSSRASLGAIHPLEHVNCFSPRSLTALARRVGLVPMRVPLASQVAFLATPNAIPRRPLPLAKAIVRPLYNLAGRTNLYAWLRKPSS